MSRDITIDELRTYLYCGEYYRRYLETDTLLWDDRKPLDIMLTVLLKWLVSYKARSGLVPSEEEVIVKVATARHRLAELGHPIIFSSQINNINLSILNFRSHINQLTLTGAGMMHRYVRSGVSVSYPLFLETNESIYFTTHQPVRHFLNSPEFNIPLIQDWKRNVQVLFLRDGESELRPIQKTRLDLKRADRFYTSALRGVANQVYLPIYSCTKVSCPEYNSCHISREK